MQREKTNGKRPGRPAPDKTLTPHAVAETALRVIDTEGLSEFSMRHLGQALGVEAMALYNHFEDKEALLDAVASLVMSRVPVPPGAGSWRARIKQVCLSIRRIALEHPNLFRLAMTRPVPPTAGLPLIEAVLGAFADAGLALDTQASAYHTCFLYVRGFCLWEIEELRRVRDGRLDATTSVAPQYPRAAAALQRIFSPDLDHQFEEGIDIILRGLPPAQAKRTSTSA